MTDPQQPEKPLAGESTGRADAQSEASAQAENPSQAGAEAPAQAETPDQAEAPAKAEAPAQPKAQTKAQVIAEDEAAAAGATSATAATPPTGSGVTPAPSQGRKGLLLGAGGVLVGAAAMFLVTAFLAPGFLAGPGSPDDAAAKATSALATKNAEELEKVACHGPDGKSIAAVPPDALALIQAANQTGPPQLALDTQAHAPVDLTVTAEGGQSQMLPAEVLLGVTGGEWCMSGIAQRQ